MVFLFSALGGGLSSRGGFILRESKTSEITNSSSFGSIFALLVLFLDFLCDSLCRLVDFRFGAGSVLTCKAKKSSETSLFLCALGLKDPKLCSLPSISSSEGSKAAASILMLKSDTLTARFLS